MMNMSLHPGRLDRKVQPMKRKLTTAAIAASMFGGVAIGSFVAPPMSAFAADDTTAATAEATARTPGQWITDSLKGLVDDGTITQSQSEAVATKLREAKPEGMGGHKFGGPHEVKRFGIGSEKVAEALGLSQEDLRTQLKTKSLADIAKEKNVDIQKVVDVLVAEQSTHIDQLVTDGKLTQEEADAKKAKITERITESVHSLRTAPPARADKIGTEEVPAAAAA